MLGGEALQVAGSPGHTHTKPYRSCTCMHGRCDIGGIVALGPDEGIEMQVPSEPKVQP